MGMGAPKPGSTLPPQGGKGGVQPPVQPQVPPTLASAKGQPQVPPVQPQVPPTLASAKGQPQVPPAQPIPSAGGKGGIINNPQLQQTMQLAQSLQQPGRPIPPQGSKGNRPLPEGYQSPFANYGFDPGLQSYLDQQMYRSYTDGGVGFQYDPTNQTFTGGTRSGSYNPIPLSVMQQAAGGNRDVLNPYFQSRFPQPTTPPPTIKPGMDINQIKEMYRGQPRPMQPQGPQQPFNPRPYPGQGNDIAIAPPYNPNAGIEQVQARPQQRGLGALQTDKFRNKLG
jgi:hypothetical protein